MIDTIDPHRPDGRELRESRVTPHVPGEAGIWILIFGDLAMFTMLFIAYLHQRGLQSDLFRESQDKLNTASGATNTLVLLSSSLLVVLATQTVRRDRLRQFARPLTAGGAVGGICFVVIKVGEYREKVSAGITPGTNEFFMYYFVLTGVHLAHVIVGLGVLLALWRLAGKPSLTKTHIAFFEGGACFWHMVDLLWIVIFPLVFLVK